MNSVKTIANAFSRADYTKKKKKRQQRAKKTRMNGNANIMYFVVILCDAFFLCIKYTVFWMFIEQTLESFGRIRHIRITRED